MDTDKNIVQITGSPRPWGDYGDILWHGMASRLPRDYKGRCQLERTGPYIPEITFPGIGIIVIRDDIKFKIQNKNLNGLILKEVKKKKIVDLDWTNWDHNLPEPLVYPQLNSPEGYILDRKNSRVISKKMGNVWELQAKTYGICEIVDPTSRKVSVDFNTWDGSDIFMGNKTRRIYVSLRAFNWLRDIAPNCVRAVIPDDIGRT